MDEIIKGSTIHVCFDEPQHRVIYIVSATNQESEVTAVNGNLRLIKGRIYYIPVDNKEIDSDSFNIVKVFSNIADKISVVFCKEGLCCVIPIVHNVLIKNGQQLCVIHN